jgi:hypothetical protein
MENPQNQELPSASLNPNPPAHRRYVTDFLITIAAIPVIDICTTELVSTVNHIYCGSCLDRTLMLVIAQTCLVAIWVGLGKNYVTWRCFAALVFIETWCLVLSILNDYWKIRSPNFVSKELFNSLILIFLTIAIPLWIGRIFGIHLINTKEEYTPIQLENRFQFSIRCLLEWISIAAIFMASLSYIFGKVDGLELHLEWKKILVEAFLYSLLTLSMTWAVLGVHWRALRIIQILTIFAIVYISILQHPRGKLATLSIFPLPFYFLIPSLWFFRSVGYRLVWRNFSKTVVPTVESAR